jgi:predicted RNA-binding protein with PUA-like domain
VSLDELKADPALDEMLVTRRGQRLSVQPVEAVHFRHVLKMAGHKL